MASATASTIRSRRKRTRRYRSSTPTPRSECGRELTVILGLMTFCFLFFGYLGPYRAVFRFMAACSSAPC